MNWHMIVIAAVACVGVGAIGGTIRDALDGALALRPDELLLTPEMRLSHDS